MNGCDISRQYYLLPENTWLFIYKQIVHTSITLLHQLLWMLGTLSFWRLIYLCALSLSAKPYRRMNYFPGVIAGPDFLFRTLAVSIFVPEFCDCQNINIAFALSSCFSLLFWPFTPGISNLRTGKCLCKDCIQKAWINSHGSISLPFWPFNSGLLWYPWISISITPAQWKPHKLRILLKSGSTTWR